MKRESHRSGVPAAVGKRRAQPGPPPLDPEAQREAWTLDLLAFALHGAVAAKVDVRGSRAPLPPVVLNLPGQVVAIDLWQAVAALHCRPRSFSQIAGRYSPVVIGAQDGGKKLRIEWWDLRGDLPDDVHKGADALAKYLTADVVVRTLDDARAALRGVGELPSALVARNPLAWLLQTAIAQPQR